MRKAYAQGSWKNLRSQWRAFWLFCRRYELAPVPTSPAVMGLYAQFLSRTFRAEVSIYNYLSAHGVKVLNQLLGFECEAIQNVVVRLTLRGIRRTIQHTPHQALPVDPSVLQDLVKFVNFGDENQVTMWCGILFAFFYCGVNPSIFPPP